MTAKRTDANQAEIAQALVDIGASVVSLHTVGGGVHDLLVGYHRKNYLLEVKTATGKLNKRQVAFHAEWRGQGEVVRTVEDALRAIGAI